jgi:Zn-dependent protease
MPVFVLGALFAVVGAEVGLSIPAAAVMGAVGGTASLIAHEFGHVSAARRLHGVRPLGVSLIWLGAATRLDGAYVSGRDQAKVAIAGPRTSFVLALSLLAVLFLPIPVGLRGLVLLLALLNVAIAALSLIPASPLDGYKLIVGLLWSRLGSEGAARRLIRRLALTWAAIEFVGTCILLIERPLIGLLVIVIAASLIGQRLLTRRPRPSA